MSRRLQSALFRVAVMGTAVLVMSSCQSLPFGQVGEMLSENHSIELGEANSAHIQIEMAVGEMSIKGDSEKLLEGIFEYNVEGWKPDLAYDVTDGVGNLLLSQPEINENIFSRGGENYWGLALSSEVPIDLEVNTMAGISEVDLSTVDLRSLSIQMAAGDSKFDLSGSWQHDVPVRIKAQLGSLVLFLPAGMGVQATIHSGMDHIVADEMTSDGNIMTNDAFGSASNNIYLEIDAQLGTVELRERDLASLERVDNLDTDIVSMRTFR